MDEEVLQYLDELRESGETNMYSAAPYLREEFGFDRERARELLMTWMQTFDGRHPRG